MSGFSSYASSEATSSVSGPSAARTSLSSLALSRAADSSSYRYSQPVSRQLSSLPTSQNSMIRSSVSGPSSYSGHSSTTLELSRLAGSSTRRSQPALESPAPTSFGPSTTGGSEEMVMVMGARALQRSTSRESRRWSRHMQSSSEKRSGRSSGQVTNPNPTVQPASSSQGCVGVAVAGIRVGEAVLHLCATTATSCVIM